MSDTFVAIDFETADDGRDSACAVGVARVEGAKIVYQDAVLIRPPREVMKFTHIHGLTWPMVADAPPFKDVWAKVLPVLDGAAFLAAHNVPFDRSVMSACCRAAGHPTPTTRWVDTLELARRRWPSPAKNSLPDVCGRLGIVLAKHHEAKADAEACARVLMAMEGRVPPVEPAPTAGPPARLTDEQKAVATRLREAGASPELALDAALGRIDPADLERWAGEWRAARAAEAAKWAMRPAR